MAKSGKKKLLLYQRLKYAVKLVLEATLTEHNKKRAFIWTDVHDYDLLWSFYSVAPILNDELITDEELPFLRTKTSLYQHLFPSRDAGKAEKLQRIYHQNLMEKVKEGIISKRQYSDSTRTRTYRTVSGGLIKHESIYWHFPEFPGFPKRKRVMKAYPFLCECGVISTAYTTRKKRCEACNIIHKKAYAKKHGQKYSASGRTSTIIPKETMIEAYYSIRDDDGFAHKRTMLMVVANMSNKSKASAYRCYRKYNLFLEHKDLLSKKVYVILKGDLDGM